MYTIRIDIENCDMYLIKDADNIYGFAYGLKRIIPEDVKANPVVSGNHFGFQTSTGHLIGTIDGDKIYIDYTTKYSFDLDPLLEYCERQTEGDIVYAELTERGVPVLSIEDTAIELFTIIDNIDTISDIAKGDDKLYRSLVMGEVKKRFNYASTNGQGIEWL